MKQYLTVPGPMSVNIGKGTVEQATDSFAQIINQQASQGWEYHSMETLTVRSKKGCFSAEERVTYYMLIFSREV